MCSRLLRGDKQEHGCVFEKHEMIRRGAYMRAKLTVMVLAALAAVTTAWPAAQEPSFRSSSSDLVVLPVTVTDSQGLFVSDLPVERFGVYDNGRRVPVNLFTNEDTPVTVGLIIDDSGSMRRKMPKVISAVLAFATLSNPDDELFALRFNDDVQDALPNHPFLLAGDHDNLEAALNALVPVGRTALYDAVLTGLERLEKRTLPRKVLVIISDGGDNASRARLDAVLDRARRSSAALFTIGVFDEADIEIDPGVLKTLARETGGDRFLPESSSELHQACEKIARTIRSGYTIGYEPPLRDGAFHRVEVKIEGASSKRLIVKTRPGYTAPSSSQ
jgi:VWFA-related protein